MMRHLLVVLFLVSLVKANVNTTTIAPDEYLNNATLSTVPLVRMYWKSNTTANLIEIAVEAEISGWVALGFGYTTNGMEEADCYIITFQNNAISVRDAYLPGSYASPIYDAQQPNGRDNVIRFNGSFSNGKLIGKFIRTLSLTSANDAYDKPLTTTSATRLAYAFSRSSFSVSSHSNRGTLSLTFSEDPVGPIISKPSGPFVIFPFHFIVTAVSIILMILIGTLLTWIRLCHTSAFGHLLFHFTIMDMIGHWINTIQGYIPQIINYYVSEYAEFLFDLTMGEWFMLILYFVNGAVWFIYGIVNSLAQDLSTPVGRAFGLWNIFNLAVIMFPVYRFSIWKYTFGISFERSIKFHRYIAMFSIGIIMTVHFILMVIQFKERIFRWDANDPYINLAGFISWILFLFMAAFASPMVRRYAFELFHASHYVFGISAIVFAAIHTKAAYLMIAMSISIILLLLDYVLRIVLAVNGKIVHLEQDETSGTTLLHVQVPKRFVFQAGQYAMLYIPRVSYTQWHPFSMSCASHGISTSQTITNQSTTNETTTNQNDTHKIITFHIKDMGSSTFTGKLRQVAKEDGKNLFIRIEGPYGTTSVYPDDYETIVLVAGGIGITPLMSMLSTYTHAIQQNHTRRLKKIILIWSVREASLVKLFLPLLQDVLNNHACKLMIHVTSKNSDGVPLPSGLCTQGRPDMNILFEQIRNDHIKESQYVGVFMCGPEIMLKQAQHACWNASTNGVHFQVHKETFLL